VLPPDAAAHLGGAVARTLPQDEALPTHAILNTMTDRSTLCRELQTTWHRDIPLAAAMAIEVASYDGRSLTVRAPLAPNRNLHGTAFAGGLFSVCVLTGWGAVWLGLKERGAGGLIVVADSHIQYRRAVGGDIVCCCSAEPEALATSAAQLTASGRTRLPLVCTVDVDGKRAVTFEGTYVVHAKHDH
jgi:thioesterase domain-containing protein